MSWKNIGITVAVIVVVLVVITLMRRSRFGDPIERVSALFMPGVPTSDTTGAAT